MQDDHTVDLLKHEKEKRISFARFVFENWHKLANPAPVHYEQMYKRWKKEK